jgi:integrase
VRTDPTRGVRIAAPVTVEPDDDEGPVKALAPEELAALLVTAPQDWRGLLVRTLAVSGLRISEGLGLRHRDLDSAGPRLLVRQRVRNGRIGAVKSTYSRREVPISRALGRALAAHRLAAVHSAPSDLIFGDPITGQALRARGMYEWLSPLMEAVGAPWAGFHSLRHTYATRLLLGGVNIATVSRLLGHHSAAFTLKVHVHVLASDLPSGEELAAVVGLD